MLDLHAVQCTPGAALVLGNAGTAVALGGDGATVAGVPIADGAILVCHGANSVTANTIANYKLSSQDLPDPLNAIQLLPGAASLLNQVYHFTKLPYKRGGRTAQLGTNTGVGACLTWLLDAYSGGPVIDGDYCMPQPVVPPFVTFGSASVTLTWNTNAYNPTIALPAGKYAILGAWGSAITNAAILRFSHSDFGGFKPGFPIVNYETISTSTWDKQWKSDLTLNAHGYQFVYLSHILKTPCVPVFTAQQIGTGLNMEFCSVQTDTPVIGLNLAKVG